MFMHWFSNRLMVFHLFVGSVFHLAFSFVLMFGGRWRWVIWFGFCSGPIIFMTFTCILEAMFKWFNYGESSRIGLCVGWLEWPYRLLMRATFQRILMMNHRSIRRSSFRSRHRLLPVVSNQLSIPSCNAHAHE